MQHLNYSTQNNLHNPVYAVKQEVLALNFSRKQSAMPCICYQTKGLLSWTNPSYGRQVKIQAEP